MRVFDPVAGQYIEVERPADNPYHYTPGRGNTIWGNVDGKSAIVLKTPGWESTGAHKHSEEGPEWTYGYQPPPPTQWLPAEGDDLVFGGGGGPASNPDREARPGPVPDPNQPTPDPTPPPVDWGGGGSPTPPPYPGTSDTSWDWGQGPVSGEYFGSPPTMNAQTMPGEISPWGVPNTPGGNKEFYRQQFSNLLSQQNAFQESQLAAAMRRNNANNNPGQVDVTSWQDRAYGGQGLPQNEILGAGYASPVPGLSQTFDFALPGQGGGQVPAFDWSGFTF